MVYTCKNRAAAKAIFGFLCDMDLRRVSLTYSDPPQIELPIDLRAICDKLTKPKPEKGELFYETTI